MNVLLLTDAICGYLVAALRDLRLKTYARSGQRGAGSLFTEDAADQHALAEAEAPVSVHAGILPPKSEEVSDFPFVVVRPTQATVENGGTLVTVAILVGTYAADTQAWRDAVNVCQRIASSLTAMKHNLLAGKYERQTELTWQEQPTDRTDPFWSAEITTTWRIYTDQFEFEDML